MGNLEQTENKTFPNESLHHENFSKHTPVSGENKERVPRKTTVFEAIERQFTTEPKRYIRRGCNTVRTRSLKYVAILQEKYGVTKEIPLDRAKRIFQEEMDIWDRTSLIAYFGTQEAVSKRKMMRISRYPRTGTVSYKTIELEQSLKRKAGYLERLGLVRFEKRGRTWFMLLENGSNIIPELTHPPKPPLHESCESIEAKASIDKISLNPIPFTDKQTVSKFGHGVSALEATEKQRKRESYRVREKFDNGVIENRTGVFSTYPKKDPSPEELRILKASTREGG